MCRSCQTDPLSHLFSSSSLFCVKSCSSSDTLKNKDDSRGANDSAADTSLTCTIAKLLVSICYLTVGLQHSPLSTDILASRGSVQTQIGHDACEAVLCGPKRQTAYTELFVVSVFECYVYKRTFNTFVTGFGIQLQSCSFKGRKNKLKNNQSSGSTIINGPAVRKEASLPDCIASRVSLVALQRATLLQCFALG